MCIPLLPDIKLRQREFREYPVCSRFYEETIVDTYYENVHIVYDIFLVISERGDGFLKTWYCVFILYIIDSDIEKATFRVFKSATAL